MNDIVLREYESPYGLIDIGAHRDEICLCDWVGPDCDRIFNRHNRMKSRLNSALKIGFNYSRLKSDVIDEAIKQLDEYFAGQRRVFDVPLLLVGTEFQKKVWNGLLNIPYGTTISYSEVAQRLGAPTSYRAVANANAANPISILVPCHRVIGSNKTLAGYAGGVCTKRRLLELEGVHIS